jgi:predicted Zn-dependent protease with MMP-like domain
VKCRPPSPRARPFALQRPAGRCWGENAAVSAPDPLDAADRAVLEHLVHEGLALLDAGTLDAAARNLAEAEAIAPHDPSLLAALGELCLARDELDQARLHLQAAVAGDPSLADAHYALARLHQDVGEHALAVHHDLQVLRLDAAAHRRAGLGSRADLAIIEEAAAQTLEGLPEPFASRLREVPVVLEPRPGRALVEEGFDPRALGLFEGPDDFGRRSQAVVERPSRIVVFFANLLDAFPHDDDLRAQVEVTLLHEIGHFFGLDEAEVDALGLG